MNNLLDLLPILSTDALIKLSKEIDNELSNRNLIKIVFDNYNIYIYGIRMLNMKIVDGMHDIFGKYGKCDIIIESDESRKILVKYEDGRDYVDVCDNEDDIKKQLDILNMV